MISIASRFVRRLLLFVLAAGIAVCGRSTVHAQFTTVINAPPSVPPGTVTSNTQLNVGPGGSWSLGYDNTLRAGAADGSSENIEVNVTGGTIGSPLDLNAGSVLNFQGGTSNYSFNARHGSVANIAGGVVHYLYAYDGSVTNVSAGAIDNQAHIFAGGEINVSGGFVGNRSFDSLTVLPGATANISGGTVGVGLNLYGGVVNVTGGNVYDGLYAGATSSLRLYGDDFRINGVPVAGLDQIGSSVALDVPKQSTLSGVYSDGTPFHFIMPYNTIDAGVLSLYRTAVPAATPGTFQASSSSLPAGLRSGQRVIVGPGEKLPDYYLAGRGSEVEVQAGGALGEFFKADGAVVDVYGTLGRRSLFATGGATINLRDGQAADSTTYLEIFRDSTLNVSGGDWGNAGIELREGAIARFSGGKMNAVRMAKDVDLAMSGGSVRLIEMEHSTSPAVFSGGDVGTLALPVKTAGAPARLRVELSGANIGSISYGWSIPFTMTSGTTVVQTAGVVKGQFPVMKEVTARLEGGAIGGGMELVQGGALEVVGGDFRIDGQPVGGLQNPGESVEIVVPQGTLFSGTLADGTPFAFSSFDKRWDDNGDDLQGKVTLIAAATPAATPGMLLASEHPALLGVREGQTLIVNSGDVVRDVFNMGRGSRVELKAGGMIGERTEAVASELIMTGGVLGERFDAFSGSTVLISGGTVGQHFAAYAGSQVRISGGKVNDYMFARPGSDVELSGGEMIRAEIHQGAEFKVTGGELGVMYLLQDAEMTIDGGKVNTFNVEMGARVELKSGSLGLAGFGSTYDERVLGVVDQSGGAIGDSLDVYMGGVVNSSGGTIGDRGIVHQGGTLNVSGGAVGRDWVLESGGVANLASGSLGSSGDVNVGAQLKATGGTIESGLDVYGSVEADRAIVGASAEVFSGGKLAVSGGAIGRGLNGRAGSEIHLYGAEFRIGDQLISGLSAAGDVKTVDVPTNAILSGVLADGSPIVLAPKQLSPTLSLDGDTIANGVLRLHFTAPAAATPGEFQAADHPDWFGVRAGQTLVVGAGASVTPHFTAASGATLRVEAGGAVGAKLDAHGAHVQVNGGAVGSGFYAYDGSTVQVAGGTLGEDSALFSGSSATILGGVVGARFALETGASLRVEGGLVNQNLRIGAGATATFAGGIVVDGVSAATGSQVEIAGGNFRLNGALLTGFDAANLRQLNIPANSVLTGAFADGTPFAFSNARTSLKDQFANGTLTLRRVDVASRAQQIDISTLETTPRALGAGVSLQVKGGGKLGDFSLLGEGSHAKVLSGGAVGNDVEMFGGTVEILGGQVGSRFSIYDGGVLTLAAGSIGSELSVYAGGVLNQRGGSISTTLRVLTGGRWNVFGSDFAIDGVPLTLSLPGQSAEVLRRTGTLTGKLANGAAISIFLGTTIPRQGTGPLAGGSLFLYSVPEPGSIVLAAAGLAMIAVRRRGEKRIAL